VAFALAVGTAPGGADELGPVRTIAGGPYEASGAVPSPDGKGILFVDDARSDTVLWMDFAPDGSPAGPAVAVPIGASVADPEGITTDGTYVFVVGSGSRGRAGGAGLMRFRFDGSRRRAQGAQAVGDLTSLLMDKLPAAGGTNGGKKGKGSMLNIEGLAWDAKRSRLLLGLRAPLDGGRAQVVPVKLRDPGGPLAPSNLEVGAPIAVDLGGSGIRALEADGAGGFWMIAGGVEGAGTSRLVRWDGTGPAVKEVAAFPDELKPEGVAPAKVGGRTMTVVLCDTSRYFLMGGQVARDRSPRGRP
jgi:hypothetical protein